MAVVVLMGPPSAAAQDGRATLETAAKSLGATGLTSLEYTATGVLLFAVGQSTAPGAPWPGEARQILLRAWLKATARC